MRSMIGTGSVLTLLSGLAFAGGLPPLDAKPLSEVLSAVEQKGLTAISDVSFDDGHWEIEGCRGDQTVELHVHPQSLAILAEHLEDPQERPPADALPASAIAARLLQAGYNPILELEWEHGQWTAEAVNSQGPRDLTLMAQTGEIVTDRAED